jgi:hypothetical protein
LQPQCQLPFELQDLLVALDQFLPQSLDFATEASVNTQNRPSVIN